MFVLLSFNRLQRSGVPTRASVVVMGRPSWTRAVKCSLCDVSWHIARRDPGHVRRYEEEDSVTELACSSQKTDDSSDHLVLP